MDRLRDQQTSPPSQSPPVSVVQISVQPKTWWGKLLACILGAAFMLVAFLVSVIAVAIVASIIVAAAIYVAWMVWTTRRSRRDRTIDGDVNGRHVR